MLRRTSGCAWYGYEDRELVAYALDVLDAMDPHEADKLVREGALQGSCLRELREGRVGDIRSSASFFLHSLGVQLPPWSYPERDEDHYGQVSIDVHVVPDDVAGLAPPRPRIYGCTERAGMVCPSAGVCALHGCQGPIDEIGKGSTDAV